MDRRIELHDVYKVETIGKGSLFKANRPDKEHDDLPHRRGCLQAMLICASADFPFATETSNTKLVFFFLMGGSQVELLLIIVGKIAFPALCFFFITGIRTKLPACHWS